MFISRVTICVTIAQSVNSAFTLPNHKSEKFFSHQEFFRGLLYRNYTIEKPEFERILKARGYFVEVPLVKMAHGYVVNS